MELKTEELTAAQQGQQLFEFSTIPRHLQFKNDAVG